MTKLVCGVGYNSLGLRVSDVNLRPLKSYDLWRSMLVRSSDKKFKQENPSYEDVSCDVRWLDYCNFSDWYSEQFAPRDWQLDKDILVKGNTVYSPEKCCMVPRKINNLFIKRKRGRGDCPIGVSFHLASNKFQAGVGGVYLGLHETAEAAFAAYKVWKENEIKKVSDLYKSVLPENVYDALQNYQVEITD